MLTFGRKPLYRPLIVSLLIGAVFGLFVGSVWNVGLGVVVFAVVVILMILNYTRKVATLDGYLQVDEQRIYYYPTASFGERLSLILLPFKKPQSIAVSEVSSYQIQGRHDKFTDVSLPLPVSTAYEVFLPGVLAAKNPIILTLTLKNEQTITINLSIDYVYNQQSFRQKLVNLQPYLPE